MSVHVECAKRTFDGLALLTKNWNVFSLGHHYSNTTCFSIFIDRNFSPRIHSANITFTLVIIWVILVNEFYRIARFVICNYVKGGGGWFWLVFLTVFHFMDLK